MHPELKIGLIDFIKFEIDQSKLYNLIAKIFINTMENIQNYLRMINIIIMNQQQELHYD